MAREHPATARSPDSFPQVSQSSAAATVGNPARATTAKHANNQYADERICIACGLRTLVGAAGIADRYSPGAHPTISRSRSSNGSSAKLVARFPVWVKMRRTHVEHIRSALAPKEAAARTLLDFAFVPITTVAEPPRQRERTASMTLRPRALAVVRLTTRSNLEARGRLGSFHQSDHAYRTCVPTFDGKWHGHHREAVVADLRQVGHELDQRQVLLHQRQVIGDPHLARIELHARQSGFSGNTSIASPATPLFATYSATPRSRYGICSQKPGLPHILSVQPVLIMTIVLGRISTPLSPTSFTVTTEFGPLPGRLISTPSLTNCETGIRSTEGPFSTMWRGASIWVPLCTRMESTEIIDRPLTW